MHFPPEDIISFVYIVGWTNPGSLIWLLGPQSAISGF